MLTKTTVTAIRVLMHVGLNPAGEPLSIRRIAEQLGESPTYLAKVARHLVKTGILKAHCGVMGGVGLNRPPQTITLLAVVEACQGAILADFCQDTRSLDGTCAFHVAAAELHGAIVEVLSRWTLDQLIERPAPTGRTQRSVPCLLRPRLPDAPGASRAKPSRLHPARSGTSGRARPRRAAR